MIYDEFNKPSNIYNGGKKQIIGVEPGKDPSAGVPALPPGQVPGHLLYAAGTLRWRATQLHLVFQHQGEREFQLDTNKLP